MIRILSIEEAIDLIKILLKKTNYRYFFNEKMIKICLTHFTYGPWVKVTINAFEKALSYFEDQFDIDILKDIPKNMILLFLLVLDP